MRDRRMNVRQEVESYGFRIVYVPHEIIKDHNACYNVVYDGKVACPDAAKRLNIPLNEIWISEKWRRYEEFVLYHEIQEIRYRSQGHDGKTAHEMAERDEVERWKDDPNWKRMNKECGVGREHLC